MSEDRKVVETLDEGVNVRRRSPAKADKGHPDPFIEVVLSEGDHGVRGEVSLQMAEQLENWFTYHSPDTEDLRRYTALREAAKAFAYVLVAATPAGADQSAALRKLRECVMTANAAIACRGNPT